MIQRCKSTRTRGLTVNLRERVSDGETADENLIFTTTEATNGQVVLIDGYIARFTPNSGHTVCGRLHLHRNRRVDRPARLTCRDVYA